ncbi:alpha/beta fold hydrolase [Corynebacterium amycolatum]|uniref:alpha/beta fold hydrolase n=1 Tax=Corynebacterium amycolatum TaxID=43765 RepID=UPI003CCC016C
MEDTRGSMVNGEPPVEPRIVQETLPDGSVTPMALRFPEGSPRGIVVIWPGFGMGARYYRPIAQELQRRGFCVLTSELRGQGNQTAVATRRHNWGYQDLASVDYPLAVARARKEFDHLAAGEKLPVYLLCHSMGGQIASLYLARPEADVAGVVMVGSGTPHYKCFTGNEYKRLRYGAPFMQVVSQILGYWPAGRLDMAGYGRQARNHVVEWARFSRTGLLRPRGADIDYAAEMPKVTTPALLLNCGGDRDCPEASAQALARMLPNSAKYEFIEQRLGHNRWAREPQAVVDCLERFIEEI